MENELKMYCICCRRIVSMIEGVSVFKTGFYRYDMPMGICGKCKTAPSNELFYMAQDL